MTSNIGAYITIRLRCDNLIDEDTLERHFGGDLEKWVRWFLEDENITGISSDGGEELISVERIQEAQS